MHPIWPPTPFTATVYFAGINALAFLLYWWDKRQARHGGWRVQERNLLLAGLLGGSPASLLAQIALRHKTRKQPFQWYFRFIVVLQLVALAFWGIAQA